MKLLTTKQLVRIGRVRCFDLDEEDEQLTDQRDKTTKKTKKNAIYPVKQKINKNTLAQDKRRDLKKYIEDNIITPIRNGNILNHVTLVDEDVSFFPNLRGLFAHYAYDIDISGWKFADNVDCSYMFAFSEFDQWEHVPKVLRDELINPQRKIDTTGIFYGCKGEKEFYQKIEEERTTPQINH